VVVWKPALKTIIEKGRSYFPQQVNAKRRVSVYCFITRIEFVCYYREDNMSKRIDLTGKKFGRLVVLKYYMTDKNRNALWKCQCECGSITAASSSNLIQNHTKSCGCYKTDMTKEKNSTHGLSKHLLFRIWIKIRERCGHTKGASARKLKYYKNRGIVVCEEWLDFKSFYNWAIANGWKKGLCIDRIDTNGKYSPSNCRFVTQKENTQNMRTSKWWVIHGKVFNSLSEAGNFFNVCNQTIFNMCLRSEPFCYSVQKYE